MVKYERFSVYEIKNSEGQTRFGVIVSPEEIHDYQETVLVLPLIVGQSGFPFRVPIVFKDKEGEVAVDKIQPIFKTDLIKKVGLLPEALSVQLADVLTEMFMI